MNTPTITHFQQAVPVSIDYPRPERLVSGNPQRQTWTHYESSDRQLSCGIWACEVGAWQIRFAADKEEFFCVISGKVCLHGADGSAVIVAAGEAAVIPAGFEGRFEVLEPVRKYFVVLDRAARG
ncbi:cupin domain-containing protein [Chitinibacter tainanensis]|uniref:cupin domain-containing protein n=1 Tax=Chitinibacter tainanensis TaxID=230667 RepID=UPI0023555E70|nr:cupin domain-containing protein [Chitinibacter tainanensis]